MAFDAIHAENLFQHIQALQGSNTMKLRNDFGIASLIPHSGLLSGLLRQGVMHQSITQQGYNKSAPQEAHEIKTFQHPPRREKASDPWVLEQHRRKL